jgi:ubiquinone/menaquinone biosynthesis C-methylase UbiE
MVEQNKQNPTSWGQAGSWYDSIVGDKGHFYHREVILPNVLRLLSLHQGDSLLDLGSGQGVLARAIPETASYVGIDIAQSLLQAARRRDTNPRHSYIKADITKPWPALKEAPFTHAACILVLQNVEHPEILFKQLSKVLKKGARAIFVINHPYFRIPRQSRWNLDEPTKTQTRELFSYMSPQRFPIITHPGKPQREEEKTWSFHVPLCEYTKMAHNQGFVIETIEEWCSPKTSTGGAAKRENRARNEFPLFMAIVFHRTV